MRSLEKSFDRYRRRGDLAALERVFDRTARRLLGLALHLVRDPQEAEDLVQTTFVTAIEKAQDYDPKRPLVPWLTGILSRHAANAIRRRREDLTSEDALERAAARATDPGRALQERELAAELEEALVGVGETYRSVLEPYLVEGKRPEEIARELDRAPGTVRAQIYRGLNRLRERLPGALATGVFSFPRGLPAVREHVMHEAALAQSVTLATGAVSTTTPILVGTLLMKKVLLAAAACAASIGLLFQLPLTDPVRPQDQPLDSATAVVLPDLDAPEPADITELAGATAAEEHGPEQRSLASESTGSALIFATVAGLRPEDREGVSFLVEKIEWRPEQPEPSREVPIATSVVRASLETIRNGTEIKYSEGLVPSHFDSQRRCFVLDVSALIGQSESGSGRYRVRARHELYFEGQADVLFPGTPRRSLERGRSLEERVSLSVDPAAILRGTLEVAEEREPVGVRHHGLEERSTSGEDEVEYSEQPQVFTTLRLRQTAYITASVGGGLQTFYVSVDYGERLALFRPGEDKPVAQVTPDGEGHFEFKLRDAGRFELVAWREGRPLEQQRVRMELLEIVELEDPIEIGNGQQVSGAVEDFGLFPEGGVGVEAMLDVPEEDLSPIDWHGTRLAWYQNRVVRPRITSETTEGGVFELTGLDRATYRIGVSGGESNAAFSEEERRQASVTVSPPTESLFLTLPAAVIEVCAHLGSGRCTEDTRLAAEILLRDSEGKLLLTAPLDQGRLGELIVRPNEEFTIEARVEGMEFDPVKVHSPAMGLREALHLTGRQAEGQ